MPEIIEQKKNYSLAIPKKIVEASNERIDPPCPYYKSCGGCNFQHASYTKQLQLKKEIVADLVCRAFPSLSPQVSNLIKDTLPSPRHTHYRQRIRLQVDTDGSLGFNQYRTHNIVNINHCLLAEDHLNTALTAILIDPAAELLLENCNEIELLLNPDFDTVIVCLYYKRKIRPTDKKAALQLTQNNIILEAVFIQGGDFPLTGPFTSHPRKNSNKMLSHSLPATTSTKVPLTFTWEVGGFSQVNLAQNSRLIELVLQYCNLSKNDRVLDLFCGMGNFSIPLALHCHSLLGVEMKRSAIRSARQNASMANLKNCTFVQANVEQFCHKLIHDKKQFDIVVLDPPRQGIPGLPHTIAQLTAKRLIYISCDPATLCRDLSSLTQSSFSIEKIQPLDMFPQTHHIETIVLLNKEN